MLEEIGSRAQTAILAVRNGQLSSRERFLLEEFNGFMNRQWRTRKAIAVENNDSIALMRKTLASVGPRAPTGEDWLTINLSQIRTTVSRDSELFTDPRPLIDQDGSAAAPESSRNLGPDSQSSNGKSYESRSSPSQMMQLAKEERMNTSARQAIFISIMSANDYRDAHSRLRRLHLNKTGHNDIPKVLVHCATTEANCNHYYSLVAQELCMEKTLKKAFQFALWDRLWRERSSTKGRDHRAERASTRAIMNLASLYGYLVSVGSLDILILKVITLLGMHLIRNLQC